MSISAKAFREYKIEVARKLFRGDMVPGKSDAGKEIVVYENGKSPENTANALMMCPSIVRVWLDLLQYNDDGTKVDEKEAIKPGPKVKFTEEKDKQALAFINNVEQKDQSEKMLAAELTRVFRIPVKRHDISRLRARDAKRSKAEGTVKKRRWPRKRSSHREKKKVSTSQEAIQAISEPEARSTKKKAIQKTVL